MKAPTRTSAKRALSCARCSKPMNFSKIENRLKANMAAGASTRLYGCFVTGMVALVTVAVPAPAFAAEGLDGASLSRWWSVPFIGILLSIATGPLLYPHLWEHHYSKFTAFWSALVVIALLGHANTAIVTTALAHTAFLEYMPFILLLLALFTVTGGIYLEGNLHESAFTNTALLGVGALMASIVGTTGAAMILIRPLIRANDTRRYNAHVVVLFIYLVANIGGALSPLGDPPLFIGFLRGVDFFWTTQHLWRETLTTAGIVLAVFCAIDLFFHRREGRLARIADPTPDTPLKLHGQSNLLLLAIVIAAILMSAQWKPGIVFHIASIDLQLQDLLRDLVFLLVAIVSDRITPREIRATNGFSWGPIKEVAILFAGIFFCIIPVMALLKAGAEGRFAGLLALVSQLDGSGNPAAYFWLTGALSSFLDNARRPIWCSSNWPGAIR